MGADGSIWEPFQAENRFSVNPDRAPVGGRKRRVRDTISRSGGQVLALGTTRLSRYSGLRPQSRAFGERFGGESNKMHKAEPARPASPLEACTQKHDVQRARRQQNEHERDLHTVAGDFENRLHHSRMMERVRSRVSGFIFDRAATGFRTRLRVDSRSKPCWPPGRLREIRPRSGCRR